MIRQPVVAGKFYPSDKNSVERQINRFIGPGQKNKTDALACILPHAGYVYSGNVAVQTAARVKIKDSIIILGPNHTGLGARFSINSQGSWSTPLGEVRINSKIAEKIKKECNIATEDQQAHAYEHSIEVELPILQYLSKNEFSIIPLILMHSSKSDYEFLAQAIYKTIVDLAIRDKILIVASSDMTHYESQESAEQKDSLAIEAILELDEAKLLERLSKYHISMCGYAPVIVTLLLTKKLGATKAELVKYQTSAETSGDYDSVVGYAGVIIS